MVSLPSPLASRWQNPSASTAGCRPGTPESTYPHHHCLCGFCKGATWAQTPILLPLTEPTLTEAGVGGGHRPGLPKNPAPSNTRSSHHSYCRHILHHRPLLSWTQLTQCALGTPACQSHLCCMEGEEFLLASPYPPTVLACAPNCPRRFGVKSVFWWGR